MRRRLLAAVITCVVGLSLFQPAPAMAGAAVTAADRTGNELVAEGVLHELTDAARTGGRLPGGAAHGDVSASAPLEGWTDLLTVARRWSDRLDFQNLRHNPDYSDQYGNWRGAGENVATTIVTSGSTVNRDQVIAAAKRLAGNWWDSTGHRRLWMNPAMDHVGIGVSLERERFSDGTTRWVMTATANFRDHDGTTIREAIAYRADSSTAPPQQGQGSPNDIGRFDDVPPSHMFHASIERLADAGVTSGCGLGRYCPDEVVTRGQMAAFLQRALDLPAGSTRFSDVPSNHTFRAAISALADAGITSGCGRGRFCPSNPVTRGQMAKFLDLALGLPPGSIDFADVGHGHTFRDPIGSLAAAKITSGCGKNMFCPENPVTRGQMAAFLDRAGLLD